MNKTLIFATLVAALGGLLFGFDAIVISGTVGSLERVFGLNQFWLGFTVASALIGTIVGALVVGKPSDLFGQRGCMMVLAVFYFLSAIGSGCAGHWTAFLCFRFLGGVAVGGSSVLSPMYIAEIAPAKIRGRLVAVNQFNIVFGALLAFVCNYVLARTLDEIWAWRWMLGVQVIPSAAFLTLLFFIPSSPRWLMRMNRAAEARDALHQLGDDEPEQRIAEIEESLLLEKDLCHTRLFSRKYARPIVFAVLLAVFNQLSGISAVMFYTPRIFEMAGSMIDDAMLQAVVIGIVNLVATLCGLALIDRVGRRNLLIVGSIGYIASLAALAGAFFYYGDAFSTLGGKLVLGALLLFVIAHAAGQGVVIWVYISEIFPNAVRSKGLSLGSLTHWVCSAAVSWTFPVLAGISPGCPFSIFCAVMVLQLIFAIFFMAETKGISLEEMQHRLGIEESAETLLAREGVVAVETASWEANTA